MMIRTIFGTVAVGLLVGAAAPAVERIVSGDAIVAVTLNGAPGRMRIDPGAPGVPMVRTDYATRAGLKRGMIGLGYSIGPVSVMHKTAVAKIGLGQEVIKRRIGWSERPYSPIADGTIGPADLPDPVIRFVFRAPEPGERTIALPMIDGGGMFGGFFGLYAQIIVGGEPMRVRFDPYHARSLANAGAALRIAAAQDGRLTGDAVPTEIAYGVERPVRTILLTRPLVVGPLSIATLGARTTDGGNATRIRDDKTVVEKVDPDEVLVTAKGKKRDPSRDRLSIGADQLGRCSSLVFDKPAKEVRLTCS